MGGGAPTVIAATRAGSRPLARVRPSVRALPRRRRATRSASAGRSALGACVPLPCTVPEPPRAPATAHLRCVAQRARARSCSMCRYSRQVARAVLGESAIFDTLDARASCATTRLDEPIHHQGGRSRGVGDERALLCDSADDRSSASRVRRGTTAAHELRAACVRRGRRPRSCAVLVGRCRVALLGLSGDQERQRSSGFARVRRAHLVASRIRCVRRRTAFDRCHRRLRREPTRAPSRRNARERTRVAPGRDVAIVPSFTARRSLIH